MAGSTRWSRVVLAGALTGAVMVAFGTRGGGEEDAPARVSVVPERIDIPSLGIKAPLMKLGVTGGRIDLPPYEKPGTAGWVEDSVVPGDEGPAVILGHVDTKTAPAVFYRLKEIKEGQAIKVVRSDGKVAHYRVDSVEQTSKTRFPADKVYLEDGLRLITCGGEFDRDDGEYRDNFIVYATLVGA
ncbi:LPXTG-site transpeptidase (sortase) family protein [Streptosporangium becharense]|uniref:LPXTG-site transpeptidase (Sortase) family protein n=1 Tax=Streptosporangium becharense TaxID=1816182 RepID=A0A7W9IFU7_9ACTN|nr:class F sortase [Streptosporangium becharense]MBB2909482.1 LPXTG-site transpeptidase (sortase) family protein [Streptosporangium becharense]MBB5819561.1 LPXTG-site transpeptidase (sortase) family protein [Streptosporangium becharense]